MNKSEQIRQLFDQGYKVQEISDRLGIRYQFAYNVVKHHIKTRHVNAAQEVAATTPQFSFWRWITGR